MKPANKNLFKEYQEVINEMMNGSIRKETPPWHYIVRAVKTLNSDGDLRATENNVCEIFEELYVIDNQVDEDVTPYDNFHSGPYGRSSSDFIYDLKSLIHGRELDKEGRKLVVTNNFQEKSPVIEGRDKRFEESLENLIQAMKILKTK